MYLSESLDLPAVFFRLGAGILHSIENATQFVPVGWSVFLVDRETRGGTQHGTPKLAASHRTFLEWHVEQALEARCLLKLGCEGIWSFGGGAPLGAPAVALMNVAVDLVFFV